MKSELLNINLSMCQLSSQLQYRCLNKNTKYRLITLVLRIQKYRSEIEIFKFLALHLKNNLIDSAFKVTVNFDKPVEYKTDTRTTDNTIKARCRLRLCAWPLILFEFVLMCTVVVILCACVWVVANVHCVNDSYGNNARQL